MDPRLPAAHQSMPQKNNMPLRMWQTGFRLLLDRLQDAATHRLGAADQLVPASNLLDYLVDFLYYAYLFYTSLLEDASTNLFRATWLEQLGDLAKYRMTVAGLFSRPTAVVEPGHELVQGRVEHLPTDALSTKKPKEESAEMASIGEAALGDFEVEESEIWRKTAMEWYSKALNETPGSGRLHSQLASLNAGDELRVLYHYARRCGSASAARRSDNLVNRTV
jgi:protein SMG6